jgi:hypothetical protein
MIFFQPGPRPNFITSVTKLHSSPVRQDRKRTYYSITSNQPVTQGPLILHHANSSLTRPSKYSIPITHTAEETTTAKVPDSFTTTAEEARPHCRPLQHLGLGENEAPFPSSPLLLLPMPV